MSQVIHFSNHEIASHFDHVAQLLEMQDANPFRVRSYRQAANQIRRFEKSVEQLFRSGGESALQEIEGVGDKLARTIRELIETGKLGIERHLQTQLSPEAIIAEVPGIGEKLAARIHDELGVTSLEGLEIAAHNGRLSRLEGFGQKRVKGIQHALASMLSRSRQTVLPTETDVIEQPAEPPLELLLELDEEYRRKSDADQLKKIAPRRFNPENKTWLPVMHVERSGWQFSFLFSNTRLAHELEKTHDWVVVFFERDHQQDQSTIVTAGTGELKGKRVVRGREAECRKYYSQGDES